MNTTAARLVIVGITALALSSAGCARIFPGREGPPADDIVPIEKTNPLLPKNAEKVSEKYAPNLGGVAIETIASLAVEPTIDGAIIRADGVARRQGAYDARLIPTTAQDGAADGVLSYTFKVYYPKAATAVGTQASRTVSVARNLSQRDLRGVRTIRVTGATNARETSRR